MKTTTRTVYGAALQAAMLLGVQHVIVEKTMLNEKFDVFPNLRPNPNEIPAMRYYAIGNGGHEFISGADGIAFTNPIDHSPKDAALYKHLPFVLRPLASDLTVEQRRNYAMRVILQIDGAYYVAYYLKRLPVKNSQVGMFDTRIVDGVEVTTPFIPDSSHLNPVKPVLPPTGATQTTTASVSAVSPLTLEFNEFDVAELRRACKTLFDDERYAIISEMSLVSGIDRQLTTNNINGQIQFNEAIVAQCCVHLSCYHNVAENSQGFIKELELGEAEPLLTGGNSQIIGNNAIQPRALA